MVPYKEASDEKDWRQHAAELQRPKSPDIIVTKSHLVEKAESPLALCSANRTLTATFIAAATPSPAGGQKNDSSRAACCIVE